MPATQDGDTNELELLPWDSDHFGFPVARLWGADLAADTLREGLTNARDRGVDLVYWAKNPNNEVPDALILEFAGRRVDQKVTFERSFLPGFQEDASIPYPYEVSEIPPGQPPHRLVDLALDAGANSRFQSDPRIPAEAVRRLYEVWITRSALREIADAVLVISRTGEINNPLGLITLSIGDIAGTIGVIAIAKEARNKGLGSWLLRAAHRRLALSGAQSVSVATQLGNLPACRLYEKCGYQMTDVKMVYHFWPQESTWRRRNQIYTDC
jgi:dTDP-4-amino-4,6-dideoxy-D-galactose acyltransferase